MFQRHCVVAQHLSSWAEEWLLFIDADMAVVNPNHLIEEYVPMDPNVHIVFYKRIFNHEIMAGSYLIRSVSLSCSFVFNTAYNIISSETRSTHTISLCIGVSMSINCRKVSMGLTMEQFMWDHLRSAGVYIWWLVIFRVLLFHFNFPLRTAHAKSVKSCGWLPSGYSFLISESVVIMCFRDYDTLSIYEVCMQMILSSNPLQQIVILEKVRSHHLTSTCPCCAVTLFKWFALRFSHLGALFKQMNFSVQ